ncbi:transposase [Halogeometricum sp. CBA1124]|nr:transposase [Halogeometricum sp. CBA1124]
MSQRRCSKPGRKVVSHPQIRVDRFHNSWVRSRLVIRQWLALFIHYYNIQRPHQLLDERTPAGEVH